MDSSHVIPAPTGAREPLKVNVFEFMKGGASYLLPLFPYCGANAMVPAGNVFWGEEGGRRMGRFFHENSVEEVGMCFGAVGVDNALAGSVFVTGRIHPVEAPTGDGADPTASMVVTITQRQGEDEQRESFIVRCDQCNHLLHRHRYAERPGDGGPSDVSAFATLIECAVGAEAFNTDEALRTCSKCGRVNETFPLDAWGWRRYSQQAAAVRRSRAALRDQIGRRFGIEDQA